MDLIALAFVCTYIVYVNIPEIRKERYYKILVIPLTAISVVWLLYGYFLAEQTEKVKYVLEKVSEEKYQKEDSLTLTFNYRCIKVEYLTRDLNLFPVADLIDKGLVLKVEGEITDIVNCKEKQND